jgi:hypothetical protein
MNISELNVMEIKALLYDSLVEQKRIANNIKILEEELANKTKEEESKEEES